MSHFRIARCSIIGSEVYASANNGFEKKPRWEYTTNDECGTFCEVVLGVGWYWFKVSIFIFTFQIGYPNLMQIGEFCLECDLTFKYSDRKRLLVHMNVSVNLNSYCTGSPGIRKIFCTVFGREPLSASIIIDIDIELRVNITRVTYPAQQNNPDSKVHGANMGPNMGPKGPRWAPCEPR